MNLPLETALISAITRVELECAGKTMNELVDLHHSACAAVNCEGILRKNILAVKIAMMTNEAWRKDAVTFKWWEEHREMFKWNVFETPKIMEFTLNCIHSTTNGQICMNCRAYDLELYSRGKFSEIAALHKCRMFHGVDLEKEFVRNVDPPIKDLWSESD